MRSYLPLNFLQEKINALQTALFFSMSSSVLKFPVTIINALKVDEAGQIWFCLPAPVQSIKEFDDGFHSLLQFFRKGQSFYLKIQGKAFIVSDPEQVSNIFFIGDDIKRDIILGMSVLIKVQIQCADYFESRQLTEKAELKSIPAQLYDLLFKPQGPAYKPQRIFILSH